MSYRVRVKICGVTSVADALLAADAGADAVGLNFAPASPRCIDLATASDIVRALPPFVEPVGVFVDRHFFEIEAEAGRLGLRTVQCHGVRRDSSDPRPRRAFFAFGVRGPESLDEVRLFLDTCRQAGHLPAALLLDGYAPGRHGGTGRTVPWQVLAGFDPGVPVILAGGLTPDNVAEAIQVVRPYGVDVASGVERGPRQKDPDLVRRFVDNARRAATELTRVDRIVPVEE
jgi:phosphoribosylanthranilate isomerase